MNAPGHLLLTAILLAAVTAGASITSPRCSMTSSADSPSMLLASSIGATGWAVTLAGLTAMLIGSLVDREWFYGPHDPNA